MKGHDNIKLFMVCWVIVAMFSVIILEGPLWLDLLFGSIMWFAADRFVVFVGELYKLFVSKSQES